MKRAPLNPDRSRLIVVGPNGEIRQFNTANEVAIFMWGGDGRKWTVYGCLEPLSFSVPELEKQVEAAMNLLDNMEEP